MAGRLGPNAGVLTPFVGVMLCVLSDICGCYSKQRHPPSARPIISILREAEISLR